MPKSEKLISPNSKQTVKIAETTQTKRPGGGSAAAGGINFQAAVTAIAGVHLLRGTPLGWFSVSDVPVAVWAESGGPGDDVRIELLSGFSAEIQAKKGLNRNQDLWQALEALITAVRDGQLNCGALAIAPDSSRTVREDLAKDIVRLSEGRSDQLTEIGTELHQRLQNMGGTWQHACSQVRIQVVHALLSDNADIKSAKEALRTLCADEAQADAAWNALYTDALALIERPGRWTMTNMLTLFERNGIAIRDAEFIAASKGRDREIYERIKSKSISKWSDPAKANSDLALSIGYDASKDVRMKLLAFDRHVRLLVVRGESGTGKTWTLCRFALKASEGCIKYFLREANADAAISAIEQAISKPEINADDIVFLVDGLLDANSVESVWQTVSAIPNAKLVVAVSDTTASTLADANVGGDHRAEYVETRFDAENVLDYLERHGIDHTSIPQDVFKILKLPLLAKVYAKISGDGDFVGKMEYQLFERFWNQAVDGKRSREVVLHELAASNIVNDLSTCESLVKRGWLLQMGHAYEFAHDRLRQWALASYATLKVGDQEIIDWITQRRQTNPYLLMDWLWMSLPANTDIAIELVANELKWPHYDSVLAMLATAGGRTVPLLVKLLDEQDKASAIALNYTTAIANALLNETPEDRESFAAPSLRNWLAGSKPENWKLAARILGLVYLPGTFSALWQRRIQDHEYSVHSLLYRAVNCQASEVPSLLLACEMRRPEQIDDVCWHIGELPSDSARQTWSTLQEHLNHQEIAFSGRGALRCIHKFRDGTFLSEVKKLCKEEASKLDEGVYRHGLLAWVCLDPKNALQHLFGQYDAYIGHRKEWVFDVYRKLPAELTNGLDTKLNGDLRGSVAIMSELGGAIPSSLFQTFIDALSKEIEQLPNEGVPDFSYPELFYACADLVAWTRLRNSAAERRLVDLAVERAFCSGTQRFCLSALAAIDGEGIAQLLSNATILEQSWLANDMLATCAREKVTAADTKNELGYWLGVISIEGQAKFFDRYLGQESSNLPIDLFDLCTPMAASSDVYQWVESVLTNLTEPNAVQLCKAWCILALAPNATLVTHLMKSMFIDIEVPSRWPLFQALSRAGLSCQEAIDRAIELMIERQDEDALNYLLSIDDAKVKQRLADLVVTEAVPHRLHVASVLLNTFPNNKSLQEIIQRQDVEPYIIAWGLPLKTIAKFGSSIQYAKILEMAITSNEHVPNVQSDAIVALKHVAPQRALKLAISALRNSDNGARKLCHFLATQNPFEAARELLSCLAYRWSIELGYNIALMLRQLDTTLVMDQLLRFANSDHGANRRAAAFVSGWVPNAKSLLEQLLDDQNPDVASAAKSAFEARSALDLALDFANQLRAGSSDRARLVEAYIQFVDPHLAFLSKDPLRVDWRAIGFSHAQEIAIESRLEDKRKQKQKIDYQSIRSFFFWSK